MKRLLLIILLFTTASRLHGQTDPNYRNTEDLIQGILEEVDGEIDLSALFELLDYRLRHPINLNRCDAEDLLELYVLSEKQVYDLLAHRDRFGKFISVYELQAIRNMDLESIYRLVPFVSLTESAVAKNLSFKERLSRMDHEIVFRTRAVVEAQRGFSQEQKESGNSYYLGDKFNHFVRYRSRLGNRFSVGFTLEKDAGEQLFRGDRKNGFDFSSAHLSIGNRGILKRLVIGDYQVRFGQGLLAWSAFAFNKTPIVNNIKKVPFGIREYRSVNEFLYFRGAAISLEKNGFTLTAFHSRKKIDANLRDTIVEDDFEAIQAAFQESGFHRTPSEIAGRKSLGEVISGANLAFNKGSFHLALTGMQQDFSSLITPTNALYRQLQFRGDRLRAVSADASWRFRNSIFFGEYAYSFPGSSALLLGWQIALHRNLDISLLYRDIKPDYNAFYSNPFREFSDARNERGFYTGLVFSPSRSWKISAYADNYFSPWLRFNAGGPSRGRDYFTEIRYKPNKREEYYIRARSETKEVNVLSREGERTLSGVERATLRFNALYNLSKALRLQSRVELSRSRSFGVQDKGYLIFQDIAYSAFGFPFSGSFRLALFDTESFNSRIYAYENDVLYFFSVPAYSGEALRYYINTKVDIGRNLDLWLRYAQTRYFDRNSISSGLAEIEGNTRSDFRIQMRYSF